LGFEAFDMLKASGRDAEPREKATTYIIAAQISKGSYYNCYNDHGCPMCAWIGKYKLVEHQYSTIFNVACFHRVTMRNLLDLLMGK